MGELIKKIGELKIGTSVLDVELNEGMHEGEPEVIHLQNENVRYACSKSEFIEMAAVILKARDNLLYYKGIDSDGKNKGMV